MTPVLIIVMGLALMVEGTAYLTGRLRPKSRSFQNPKAPIWWRNAPSVFLPGGLTLVLAGVANLAFLARDSLPLVVSYFLGVALLASGVVTLRWAFRPPWWLKPSWLRGQESPDERDRMQRSMDATTGWLLGGGTAAVLAILVLLGVLIGVLQLFGGIH